MKKIISISAALIMLLGVLAGCGNQNPINVEYEDTGSEEASSVSSPSELLSIAYPAAIAFDDYEAKIALREENEVDEGIISSINGFSSESTSVILSEAEGNACYSPISLYMALALLSTGTGGETKQELTELLGEEDTEYLSEQMGKLFRLMYVDNEYSKLYMTNSLWINKDYQIKKQFVDNAMDNFYAAANNLDFSDPKSGEIMSQWISDNTGGLLKPEIETDILDLLFIINTVYLKDEWKHNFDESATEQGAFILDGASIVEAQFMNGTFDCEVTTGGGFTAASLELKSAGSMMFVLPDEGVDALSLLSSAEDLGQMMSANDTQHKSVSISLPKFSFEHELDLIESLKAMGLKSMFDFGTADLSGITDEECRVSKVKHGTDITVNENGLEAAAFTLIEIELRGAMPSEDALELNFNRPFIFIVQSDMGVPLFIGVVQNPAK